MQLILFLLRIVLCVIASCTIAGLLGVYVEALVVVPLVAQIVQVFASDWSIFASDWTGFANIAVPCHSALSAVLPATIAVVMYACLTAFTKRSRYTAIQCQGCGYIAIGSTGAICPECGETNAG